MIEAHLAKLRTRGPVSAREEQAIRAAVSEVRQHTADTVVVRRFVDQDHSTLLLDGIMCRYKDLKNGRRQITELHVAGDFADLHSFTLENLRQITEALPRLTRMYWFQTNVDAAIHREWELSLGRRTAKARLAMLFAELQVRLEVVGLANERGYALPLTQVDLAECSGLTNVHVNRTMRELREEGVVDLQGGRVIVHDRAALWRIAEFDPRYLYLDKRER
jgi:CRP-like cAMP-binding protein